MTPRSEITLAFDGTEPSYYVRRMSIPVPFGHLDALERATRITAAILREVRKGCESGSQGLADPRARVVGETAANVTVEFHRDLLADWGEQLAVAVRLLESDLPARYEFGNHHPLNSHLDLVSIRVGCLQTLLEKHLAQPTGPQQDPAPEGE
jgi:hypothetical protein